MKKLSVCVLFGGASPEHEMSLQSAEYILNCLDSDKYNIFPVGITKNGDWVLFTGTDYSMLTNGTWQEYPKNRRAAISPVRGQGLLSFEGDCVVREWIDVVFPMLHGVNGEDGSVQGLLQLAGIPYVGAPVPASAIAIDKILAKQIIAQACISQADWSVVYASELGSRMERILNELEGKFSYPMFVKPGVGGACLGICKACNRQALQGALEQAGEFGDKILVEECVAGLEIEVAVMGNENPVASVCGEIETGADFYDFDAEDNNSTAMAYIPARISDELSEHIRDLAIQVYHALGCKGLASVEFFISDDGKRILFNEINTIPGFTADSMYPKLFAASGISGTQLVDGLLTLAMENTQ